MTNTDQSTVTLEQDQWSSRPLNEAQEKNRNSAAMIPFGEGGTTPENFAQAVDFAKHMAQAKGAVGLHLVGNYAACLAVIELSQQFHMRAFMFARQTYLVNGMIAFDGQLIMSIMNQWMPLELDENGKKTRLMHRFEGEKAVWEPVEIEETDRDDRPTGKKIWISKLIRPSTRRIILTGRMKNEATDLLYESPPVFQIKNKKSPLWEEDEDQQLIYWGSRRWQRRHWPEGLLGIVDREEAMAMHLGADHAKLIEASNNPGKALIERIKSAQVQTDDADKITSVREGFHADHAHNETQTRHAPDEAKASGADEAKKEAIVSAASDDGGKSTTDATDTKPKGAKARSNKKHASDSKKDGDGSGGVDAPGVVESIPEHEVMPKNETEWAVYCLAWIEGTAPQDLMKRWNEERKLRNDCGVVSGPIRDEIYEKLNNKIHEGDAITKS